MRVGIVSIFDNENIGNRLQNYGMYRRCIDLADNVCTIKNKGITDSIIKNVVRHSAFSEHRQLNQLIGKLRKTKFLDFNDRFLKFSEKTYWMNQGNVQLSSKDQCNLYCAGSDQIWNPLIGRTGDFNFLGFAERDRTFSYAASFGIEYIPEEYADAVRKGLQHIKYISVREEAGKRIVEELTGRTDVYVHVDPTMLLTTEEWDAVTACPKNGVPKKYILTYFLGEVSEARKSAIEHKARELGCEIIALMDKNGSYYNCGPSEFIYLIKHAAMVCTDSFHGSVFSFLYEKPFVVFDRKSSGASMSSRLETLCDKFGLRGCMAQGDKLPHVAMTPDYSYGFAALEAERKRSAEYFDMVFEEAERLGLCR